MKKRKKILLIVSAVLLVGGLLGTICIYGINKWVKNDVARWMMTEENVNEIGKADCILVLGAGVRDDGTPSLMLRDRLNTAIRLYESGAADKLLMSGDHGRRDYDEVNVMKGYAIEAGVPSEDIFMDHAGFSTYESAYRAREVFQAEKVIIVTQQYHLYRALYVAERLGLEPYGVPAEDISYYGQTVRELREVAARVKDFFTVMMKPEPTYLGEAIPVSGNGDVTNDK